MFGSPEGLIDEKVVNFHLKDREDPVLVGITPEGDARDLLLDLESSLPDDSLFCCFFDINGNLVILNRREAILVDVPLDPM